MTDAMFRQVLEQLSADLREGREYMQSLAHNVSVVGGTCMRIEERLENLSDRLKELRDDHDRVCVEIKATDIAIAARIGRIEKQAAWVKAWSAGALAVVTAAGGAMLWLVSQFGGK